MELIRHVYFIVFHTAGWDKYFGYGSFRSHLGRLRWWYKQKGYAGTVKMKFENFTYKDFEVWHESGNTMH